MRMRTALPVITLLALLPVAELRAQLNRAYVSAEIGSDANACSFAAPCRTFGQAISVLNSGGEIIVRHGGGFVPFTIDRSLTIQAQPSVYAGVIAGSGDGITIDAGGGRIVIRGVSVTGVGGEDGIQVDSAESVYLDRVAVQGFATYGVRTGTSPEDLHLSDFEASHNWTGLVVELGMFATVYDSRFDGNSGYGAVIEGEGTFVRCSFDHNSGAGLLFSFGKGVVVDSQANQNSVRGFHSQNGSSVILEGSTASFNDTGLGGTADAVMYVSNSTIAYNRVGISSTMTTYSRGNNSVVSNELGIVFSATYSPK